MTSRQQLDRIALQITGQDIRLVGFWEPLPGLNDFPAEFARALGVSEGALLRCRDIVDVLDLTGDRQFSQAIETGSLQLFE